MESALRSRHDTICYLVLLVIMPWYQKENKPVLPRLLVSKDCMARLCFWSKFAQRRHRNDRCHSASLSFEDKLAVVYALCVEPGSTL